MQVRGPLAVSLALLPLVARLTVAASPSFTLAPGSPTLGVVGATAADVLEAAAPPGPGTPSAPVIGIPGAALGLVPGDVVAGLSFGLPGPLGFPTSLRVNFSVSPATVGAASSTLQPHVTCEAAGLEAEADVFFCSVFVSGPPNVQVLDGDGVSGGSCPGSAAFGLGLIDPPAPGGDDLTGLEACPASYVFSGGALVRPVYLALAPGSPTLGVVGATAGDILRASPPGFGVPTVAVTAGALGLVGGAPGCGPPACDAVDAIEVGATLLSAYSLAPGSPSLALCGISPADWRTGPSAPCGSIFGQTAAALGLLASDDIDALAANVDDDADLIADACDPCPGFPGPGTDTDSDGLCDANDNCDTVPNPDQADVDHDGLGAACDPCDLGFGTADADGDGVLDACDGCPNLPGVSPLPLTDFGRFVLVEPPGSGTTTKYQVSGIVFSTTTSFDPATVDHVRVTALAFPGHMLAGTSSQGQWVQPNPTKKRWRYRNLAGSSGVVFGARLVERPPGSNLYRLRATGRESFGLSTGLRLVVQIGDDAAGACFEGMLTCSGGEVRTDCVLAP